MTLARTALRLATVACLEGENTATGPTLAHNRVYDSRIDDFTPEVFRADAKPTIIVLTDEDSGDALSDQNGGPPFRRNVNLVIEFAMVQGYDVPVEDGGTAFVPGYPTTDAEHEASLDLLEFQIKRRLGYDLDSKCAVWRNLARPWKFDCHRQVLDDQGVKIAARILTWECEISDDKVQMVNPAQDDTPSGFNLLPEPLRSVADMLRPGSSGYKACVAIADALNPLTLTPLSGIDFTVVSAELESDMFDIMIEVQTSLDVPEVVATGPSVPFA